MIKNQKTKLLTTIVLIMLLSISTVAVLQSASAHTPPWEVPTYAYLAASPDTVGVGEYTLLIMWLNTVVPTAGGTGGDAWRDFKINVTAPDGSQSTLGPFTSGAVGTTFTTFTPDQVGTYTMVFYWPGQILTNGTGEPNFRGLAWVNDHFLPSQSAPITLTVTQNPTEKWQESPLPTEYWSRPINGMNREWSSLASNWLGGSWLINNFQSAGQAPNSPHIVWQKRITDGGIADAQWPGIPYNVNDYDSPWRAPIIMNGRVYVNAPVTGASTKYGYYCLDLQTGEQIWYKNGTDNGLNNPVSLTGYASGLNTAPRLSQTFPQLSFGQLYHYYSVNGRGIAPYLWMTQGSTWYMLEAETGNWIMTLKNVPGGTTVVDQDGSLLRYSYDSKTGNLLCWNSSQAIPPAGPTGTSQQQWKPRVGATIDAVNDTSWTKIGPVENQWDAIDIAPRSGYTMNVTIEAGLPVAPPSLTDGLQSVGQGSINVVQDDGRVPRYIVGFRNWDADRAVSGGSGTFAVWCVQINYGAAPYSPYPDKTYTQNNNLGYTATLLWNKNYTGPLPGNITWIAGPIDYNSGIFTIFAKETAQWFGYKISDGSLAWGPTEPEVAWDMYGDDSAVAYGNLYACGYGGVLYCYDINNGNLKWSYTAKGIGYETPYGNYPLEIGTVADNKVYLYSTEHSPTKPLWRGSMIRCIDANTGDELWVINNFDMGLAVADGFLVSGDAYNNMIECYGKGKSATTVTVTPKVVTTANSVLIEGTVTDQSPGAPGTPAIADQYMQKWMEYLYMQQAKPTDATGVSIRLTAIDANGESHDIGTVTSDIDGKYSIMWTPPIEGKYTIVANFDGTNSYYASHDSTALGVGSASANNNSSAASVAESDLTVFIGVAVVALIVAIIAVALTLRRRK